MDRRRFLAALCALPAAPAALALPAAPSPLTHLIQRSPPAGFHSHKGEALWRRLRVGQSITLARESDNLHDPRAARLAWRGPKFGYLPRVENSAASQMMDRNLPLTARIARLKGGNTVNSQVAQAHIAILACLTMSIRQDPSIQT